MFQRVFAALTPKPEKPGRPFGTNRFFSRWNQRQVNGRHVNVADRASAGLGNKTYWGPTGPRLDSTKISGNYVQIPLVAPPTAPAEHKKMILTQTAKKLENISADWSAKADFLFERFSGVCANVRNEAELRIANLEDFTSEVYEFSTPVGLTVQMEHVNIAGRYNANQVSPTLKYLQMDVQLQTQLLASTDKPIPGLPGPRSLQVVLKLPTDPDNRNQIHPGLNPTLLSNPPNLIAYIKAAGLPVEFGIINTRTNLFDPGLWDKEFKKLFHECLFFAMKTGLFRDYVGDNVIQDTHTRLQRCKQGKFINGKYVVKRIEDFHSEFMLIVHDYDPKKPIPCNLAQIEFHNLVQRFQDKLVANNYKPPEETGNPVVQYSQLAELKEAALKVEKEFDDITDTIRSVSGVKRSNSSTSAFFSPTSPHDPEFFEEEESMDNNMDMVNIQNVCLASHLSVAEEALRKASGEKSPLKCWGCSSFPEYEKDCFHRFIDCPHTKDPRVHQAFQDKMKSYGNRNRNNWSNHRTNYYGPPSRDPRKQARAMLSSTNIQNNWSELGFPNKEVAAFVATSMANPNMEPNERASLASAMSLATHDSASDLPSRETTARAMIANTNDDQAPPPATGRNSPPFTVLMVAPVVRGVGSLPVHVCPGDWTRSWKDSLPPPLDFKHKSDLLFLPDDLKPIPVLKPSKPTMLLTASKTEQPSGDSTATSASNTFTTTADCTDTTRPQLSTSTVDTECSFQLLGTMSSPIVSDKTKKQVLAIPSNPDSQHHIGCPCNFSMEKTTVPAGFLDTMKTADDSTPVKQMTAVPLVQRDVNPTFDQQNTSKKLRDSNQEPPTENMNTMTLLHNSVSTKESNFCSTNQGRTEFKETAGESGEPPQSTTQSITPPRFGIGSFIHAFATQLDDLLHEQDDSFTQILSWYHQLSKLHEQGTDITQVQVTLLDHLSTIKDEHEPIKLHTTNKTLAQKMNKLLNKAFAKSSLPLFQNFLGFNDDESICEFVIHFTTLPNNVKSVIDCIIAQIKLANATVSNLEKTEVNHDIMVMKVQTATEVIPFLLQTLLENRLIAVVDDQIQATTGVVKTPLSLSKVKDQKDQTPDIILYPESSATMARRKIIHKAQRHALNLSEAAAPRVHCSDCFDSVCFTEQEPHRTVDQETGMLSLDLNGYYTHDFTGEKRPVPEDIVEQLHARNRSVLLNPFFPYRDVQEVLFDSVSSALIYKQDSQLWGALLNIMIDVSNQLNDPYILEFFNWGQCFPEEIDTFVDLAIANKWIMREDFTLLSKDSGQSGTNFAESGRHHFVPLHPLEIKHWEQSDPPNFFLSDDDDNPYDNDKEDDNDDNQSNTQLPSQETENTHPTTWTQADRLTHVGNLARRGQTQSVPPPICRRFVFNSHICFSNHDKHFESLGNVAACVDTGSPNSMRSLKHLQQMAPVSDQAHRLLSHIYKHATWMDQPFFTKESQYQVKGKIHLPFAPMRQSGERRLHDAFNVEFLLADEIANGFHWPCLFGLKDLHHNACRINMIKPINDATAPFEIWFQSFPGNSYCVTTLCPEAIRTSMMNPFPYPRTPPISSFITDVLISPHKLKRTSPSKQPVSKRPRCLEEAVVSMEEYCLWEHRRTLLIQELRTYEGKHAYFTSRDVRSDTELTRREALDHARCIQEMNNAPPPLYPVLEDSITIVTGRLLGLHPHTKVITEFPVRPMHTYTVPPEDTVTIHSMTRILRSDFENPSLRFVFVTDPSDNEQCKKLKVTLSNQLTGDRDVLQPILRVKNASERMRHVKMNANLGTLCICKTISWTTTHPSEVSPADDDTNGSGNEDQKDNAKDRQHNDSDSHTPPDDSGSADDNTANSGQMTDSSPPHSQTNHLSIHLAKPPVPQIEQEIQIHNALDCDFQDPPKELFQCTFTILEHQHLLPGEEAVICTGIAVPPSLLTTPTNDVTWTHASPKDTNKTRGLHVISGKIDCASNTKCPTLLIRVKCSQARKGRHLRIGDTLGEIKFMRGRLVQRMPSPSPNEQQVETSQVSLATPKDQFFAAELTTDESLALPTASTTIATAVAAPACSEDCMDGDQMLAYLDSLKVLDPHFLASFDIVTDSPLPCGDQDSPTMSPTLAQPAMACLIYVKCLQSFVKNKPHPVAVSDKLPHILLPLGKHSADTHWKHFPHLRAVFDTGAGVSLGYLPFFQDLHEKMPHLVHEFSPINPEIYSEILVGNIDKNCDAASCSHYIELYTPFMDQGQPVTMRLALSPELSVNALLGIPFMKKAKMMINLADDFVHSSLFQTSFHLEYLIPTLRECLPLQDGQSAPTFIATQETAHGATSTLASPNALIFDPNNPRTVLNKE